MPLGKYNTNIRKIINNLDDLDEAKYEWRIDYLYCTDYTINPFDYETEDKYLEALAKAKLSFLPPSL